MQENIPLSAVIVILFLIFSGPSFGDEEAHNNIFNEFINSPEDNSENSTDKNIDSNQVMNAEVPEKSKKGDKKEKADKTDSKRSLQRVPAKDKTCAKDSDCTAGVADCVSWEAYNKKYSKELLKNPSYCSDSIDPGFKPVTVCVAKVCETTEKYTDDSWDDWLGESINLSISKRSSNLQESN